MDKQVFDKDRLIPTYFKLSLPVVFGMVVSIVYNLADTYFIGQTQNPLLVAGVSLCSPLFTALMALGNIFGQGGNSLIARMLGAGDHASVRRVSSFCFYIALLTGAVVAVPLLLFRQSVLTVMSASADTLPHASSYYTILAASSPVIILNFIHINLIRSEGMATQSMLASLAGSVLNIILDPIFISVLGMGAAGAAIATVLGYVLTDAVCLVIVLRKCRFLSVSAREAHVNREETGQILGVGLSAAITNLSSSVCVILMNQYLVPYGDAKIAALGIASRATMIVFLVIVGFAFGGVPLFGYLAGAGEKEKLRQLLRFCALFLGGLALTGTVIIFLAARPMMGIFIRDEGVIADGSLMLRWQIGGTVFAAVVTLYNCLFQASGKAWQAMALSLSRQGVLFLLVLWILTAAAGYQGFLMTQLVADVLSAGLAIILYRKTFL